MAYRMKTVFFVEDVPMETIIGFLYITPQPFGLIDIDGHSYRLARYNDVMSKENNVRVICRNVYLVDDYYQKVIQGRSDGMVNDEQIDKT